MSNATFAAAAADAINYSDNDDEESSESEEVSDVSVATSSDDSGKDSNSDDDGDDGNTEEAVFLRDARNIQNRMSRCVGTAAMEDRQFRGLFGACIEIVLKVWLMLGEGGLRPKKSKPKHLLCLLLADRRVPSTQRPFGNGCGSSLSASPSWRTMW